MFSEMSHEDEQELFKLRVVRSGQDKGVYHRLKRAINYTGKYSGQLIQCD